MAWLAKDISDDEYIFDIHPYKKTDVGITPVD